MDLMQRLFRIFPSKSDPAPKAGRLDSEAQATQNLLRDYFDSNGGVANVIKLFESKGFANKVRSWTAQGPALPINSVEALQLIGWKDLRAMSEKAGIPVDRLRDLLVEALPAAVGKARRS